MINLTDLEGVAAERLPPSVFDYVAGGAEDESTLRANVTAWEELELWPHVLRDVSSVSTATTVLGHPVDLGTIKCDTYVTGALSDHLTPWQGCYRTTQLVGGESTFVLSNAGHIASLVNPPGNPKARMVVGPEPGADPDAWRAAGTERVGTWWQHWAEWIADRAGPERRSPQKLGSRKHKAGDPAPGQYIHSR